MRLLAALTAAATLGVAPIHFPRDHYGHRAGIEWWYFTGYGHGSNGHRYSVFFTLFKRGSFLLPVSQVVDLDSGAIVKHTEALDSGTIGATRLDFRSGNAGLRYDDARRAWVAAVATKGYALVMSARAQKPYVLHGGGTGLVHQGTATSRYYSATRMTMSATVKRAGAKPLSITGSAWFDHQWGNFTTDPSALHWDWFSCRFDDRTELMLYRFRDGRASGTFVDRSGHGRLVRAFDAVAGPRSLRALNRRWPLDWTLHVTAPSLRLSLRAMVPDQLVRGTLLPAFWEGASTARGTKSGVCFVEETS